MTAKVSKSTIQAAKSAVDRSRAKYRPEGWNMFHPDVAKEIHMAFATQEIVAMAITYSPENKVASMTEIIDAAHEMIYGAGA